MSYDFPQERPNWSSAIHVQLRVIGALTRREMRAHFGESRMGYLWALVEPAIYLGVLMVMFIFVLHRHAYLGSSVALFILSGIVPYFLYSKVAGYVSGAVSSNRSLLTLPLVKPHDVVIARSVLESTTYFFVGFLMFLTLFINGIDEAVPYDLLSVILSCSIAVALGVGIGMINIVLLSFIHNWMTFFGFISMPMWFFSGLWYLPDHVPEPFRHYLLYNPMVHVILLFRAGVYRDFRPASLDVPYAVAFVAIVFALGLALMRIAQRRVLRPL